VKANVVAGYLGIVSFRVATFFFRFFVSGLGLIPKAGIVTVGYGLQCYLPHILFFLLLMFMNLFQILLSYAVTAKI